MGSNPVITTDLIAGVIEPNGRLLLEGDLLVVVHAASLQRSLPDVDSGGPEFASLLESRQTPGLFQLLLSRLPLGLLALGVGKPARRLED